MGSGVLNECCNAFRVRVPMVFFHANIKEEAPLRLHELRAESSVSLRGQKCSECLTILSSAQRSHSCVTGNLWKLEDADVDKALSGSPRVEYCLCPEILYKRLLVSTLIATLYKSLG